jgi:SAM-dependent methyltransferase
MAGFEFPGEYYEIIRSDFRDVEAETTLLASYLPDGGRVLDIGCGTGTTLRALAERGYDGVGVDASACFIDYAKNASSTGNTEYVHADAADYVPSQRFDLVVSLFGSLNYVARDRLRSVLTTIEASLAPGGHAVLEVAQMLNAVEVFQPTMVQHHRADGVLITRTSRQMVNPHMASWINDELITVRGADGVVQLFDNRATQAIITTPELVDLLQVHGLEVVSRFGGFRREPAPPHGRGPLVLVAQRAGEAAS